MTNCIKSLLLSNLLLVLTLGGVLLGFVIGFTVRGVHPSDSTLMWLGLPGQLYLRLLKMIIVPLIVCSVISGAAALDPKANGKISLMSFVFIVTANAMGSLIGICAVYAISPGKYKIGQSAANVDDEMQTEDVIADLIRNIIPDNLFEATFAQTQTVYETHKHIKEINGTSFARNVTENRTKKYLEKTGEANYLGLIFACTLLGLAASKLKEKAKLFLDLIESISSTVIATVRWFLWTTPVGVISLIGVSLASAEHIGNDFSRLALFIVAITMGIVFQQLILMSGIYFAFTRRNPYKYLVSIARPWMISFASTTTAVAIPEMLAACEDKNNIDKRVSRFVIPFSVTINRSGSALYISGATLFVASTTGTDLQMGDVFLIWLLVSVVAIAIPAIPSASIVTTIMILSSLNIPADDVALLVAVEWYLDRLRSTGNVVSHTVCAAVIWALCRNDLEPTDMEVRRGCEMDEMNATENEIEIIIEHCQNAKVINTS